MVVRSASGLCHVMIFAWGTSPVVACVFNILWSWGPRGVRFVMFFRIIGESWCVSEIGEIVVVRSASGPGHVMIFVWGTSPVVACVFNILWSWGPRSVRFVMFVMFFRIIGESWCVSEIGEIVGVIFPQLTFILIPPLIFFSRIPHPLRQHGQETRRNPVLNNHERSSRGTDRPN